MDDTVISAERGHDQRAVPAHLVLERGDDHLRPPDQIPQRGKRTVDENGIPLPDTAACQSLQVSPRYGDLVPQFEVSVFPQQPRDANGISVRRPARRPPVAMPGWKPGRCPAAALIILRNLRTPPPRRLRCAQCSEKAVGAVVAFRSAKVALLSRSERRL